MLSILPDVTWMIKSEKIRVTNQAEIEPYEQGWFTNIDFGIGRTAIPGS